MMIRLCVARVFHISTL